MCRLVVLLKRRRRRIALRLGLGLALRGRVLLGWLLGSLLLGLGLRM